MGFVDKIKNALFEEVEEEVEEEKEEKPKKEKVKKSGSLSVKDRLIKREKEREKEKEKQKDKEKDKEKEKPIAKKVVLDDTLDERVDYHELRDEDFDIEPLTDDLEEENSNSIPSFTVIDERDLIVDDYVEEKPLISETHSKEKAKPKVEEFNYYEEKDSKPYGINKDSNIKMHEYGAISKKEEKSVFRPSPIISPIYGLLDKNYKKEDIVNRRETHITSSYERRNLSVDDVRKKAYGTISDDLIDDMDKEVVQEEKQITEKFDDNVLVDLSDENKKPEIDTITMGDAEEYFEDLGLEYNVDYVDASKDNKKEEKKEVEEVKEKKVEVKKREKDSYDEVEEVNEVTEVAEDSTDDSDDDNLFDLIDSMYQEKE